MIKVVELFAGVGGFRIGLERASKEFKTIWSNQWEPSTKKQDASDIYVNRFGSQGHSNEDINKVKTEDIPDCDLLVGGFPCQDYSVATTLNRSGGIEGKKGVLWWQIYRILKEKENKPKCLFFENVDRLLSSPATQRGRDFTIILASLTSLGYSAEWRVINAADYGMPQRRRRTYILGYLNGTNMEKCKGLIDKAFPIHPASGVSFRIDKDIKDVSDNFNKGKSKSPFLSAGYIDTDNNVYTYNAEPYYNGKYITLGDILVDESDVPEEFYISDKDLDKWKEEKGTKRIERISKDGHPYVYSQGSMAFPDSLDKPSRTIITGEGGKSASRFKHIVYTEKGLRRLTPVELERLNMFPDNHTKYKGVSDTRRAFLMGNALVCGVVEKIGKELIKYM